MLPRHVPGPFSMPRGPDVAMIDAHCHFWRLNQNDCTWPPPELTAIHRDFFPDDWQRAANAVGIDAAIAVQSQPSDGDTDWLLELTRDDPRMAGMIGWVNLAAPGAPGRIAALAEHPKLRGLRPMLQDLPDDDWILQPIVTPAIEAMVAHGLCLDVLVRPRHLPHLLRFAERHPALRVVIDHAAKPDIAGGVLDPWRARIARLAEFPNVVCKLSGLLTEAGEAWRPDALRPYLDHLLATFGPRRLLWGSDWPVVNLAADYSRWFDLVDTITGVAGDERAALFGDNAARVYGIEARGNQACDIC